MLFTRFRCGLLVLALAVGFDARGQVRISEFMASNTHTLLDADGASSDWIELQNLTTNSVSLLNWALTDSSGNPGKWRFPPTNMPPGVSAVNSGSDGVEDVGGYMGDIVLRLSCFL